MTPRRSRFVGNTAALVVSTVLATALTLAQMKILAAALPLASFGLFAALRGLSLLIAMLAANGFPQLLTRYLPEHAARTERAAATRVALAALALTVVACAAILAVVLAARGVFFVQVPSADLDPRLFAWFAVTTVAVAVKLVLYGGFNGLRRFGTQTVIETGALAVQVGWMAIDADRLSLVRLFEIVGSTSAFAALLAIPLFARCLRGDISAGAAAPASSYRAYWLGAAGLSVVALAFTDADRWVLSTVLALESLSLFHVASRIARLGNRFIAIPVLAFQPEITRVASEGRVEVVAESTRAFFKASVVASVFAAAAIAVYAEDLIRLVSSEAFLSARPTLWLLAACVPLSSMTAPLTAVMKALDGVRAALACDLVWACVYLVLLVSLAGPLGVAGAGVAQLAACVVQLVLATRLSPVKPRVSESIAALLKAVVCAGVAFAPVVLLKAVDAPGVVVWGAGIAALLLYVRGARWLGVITPGERERLSQSLAGYGLARGLAWWMP